MWGHQTSVQGLTGDTGQLTFLPASLAPPWMLPERSPVGVLGGWLGAARLGELDEASAGTRPG